MADQTIAVPYYETSPPVSLPRQTSNNFSSVKTRPMYLKLDRSPVFLAQTDFGSSLTQQDARTQWCNGILRKLTVFVDASNVDREWCAKWETYASDYINSQTTKPRGQKKKLAMQNMLSTGMDDLPRLKMTADPEVLEDLCGQLNIPLKDAFNIPSGIYDCIFTVSGVWQNGQGYGLTLRGLKFRLRQEVSVAKRLKPSDYKFPEIEDEDKEEGEVMVEEEADEEA